MGQSPSGTSYNENGEGTPFLQGNAEFGDIFPKHKKFTTEPSKIAAKGSVLISVRAPVGDTNIADLNYCIGRGLASISLKNGDNKYLLYLFRLMKPMIEAKGTGSTFKAISKSILNEIEIPVPPLPVQRQIVAMLEQAEALKRQRQEADALTEALLQSVFYEMFGDPGRNEKGWPVKKFGDITINFDEKRIPIKKSEREITNRLYPYYGASGIIDYVDDFIFDGDFLLIGEDGANLLARSTPIAFRASGKIWVNNHAHILQSGKETCDVYLEFFINSIDLEKYVTGSAQPKLTQKSLNGIEVPLPPLALQQQFARVVEEVERVRQHQAESGKEIGELCEGLIQRAFSGELSTGNA